MGSDNSTPTPLSKEEVDSLLSQGTDTHEKFNVDFRVGDIVRVIDGPFKDYDGKISEIDDEKGRIKVLVPVFGRDTALELDSLQVKRI